MNFNFPLVMTNPLNLMPPIPAVGFRFHPTNEELVNDYLKPKVLGHDVEDLLIMAEVNICKYEPWDLPDMSVIKSDDLVWYFLCRRDFKYKKSRRSNRRTKKGYWKPTGKIVKIRAKGNKKVIGIKKNLVFYEKASPKPKRTGWIIHEYEYISDSSPSNQHVQGDYVLCKLKKKSDMKTHKGERMATISDVEAEPSCCMASDFENQNHSELTANSACVESESSHCLASDFENQNSNELVSNLAYDRSGLCHSMTSNYENQYPNEQIVNSAYNRSDQSHLMASDHENQDPLEMTCMSPFDNWLMASDLEVPLSPLQLLTSDFENQNQDKETDISAPNKGEKSSLTMPLDLENQNPREKIDMSSLEEGYLLCSTVSPENSPADAPLQDFPELSPQLWADLDAYVETSLELDCSLNGLLQPPASASTEEIPPYTGFGTSVY